MRGRALLSEMTPLIFQIALAALPLPAWNGTALAAALPAHPSPPGASARLHAVVSDYSQAYMRQDPFSTAAYYGVEEDLGRFGDYPGPDFTRRAREIRRKALDGLKGVEYDALPLSDQRLYQLFKEDMQVSLQELEFPSDELEFNPLDNRLHDYIDQTDESLTQFPFDSVTHYEDFVHRSEEFPAYVDRQIAVLRRGMRDRIVLSCPIARATLNTYQQGLEPSVEKNPFWRPIVFMPRSFPAADRARLAAEFRKMILERILPGYGKLDRFFRQEYLPHCRQGFGIGSLPDGKRWYATEILARTGLSLDPGAIHALGLREVARISSQMDAIRRKMGFRGSLQRFIRSLTEDPRYFFKTPESMFRAFAQVKAAVAAKIPRYFSLIPKTDYKLVQSSNPEEASSSYREPTDSQPFGRFVVTSLNLRSVPIYDVTTLSLHEAVPGHHFQLGLQFEMKDRLTDYQRRIYFSNAFAEGWALYAEYLGREMGMYSDPLQRLGNLNDDMLRAVRLVVDTGIHSRGWSRKRVIAYMSRYLAYDYRSLASEANRYAVWPAQALSYKLGQLKLIELRNRAERELGPRFDLREFHRAVLGNGTVSLHVLEEQVDDWIRSVKRNGSLGSR